MTPRARGIALAAVSASSLFVAACGGAATPSPTSPTPGTGPKRGAAEAAPSKPVSKSVAGVEIVPGTRKLKVAGDAQGNPSSQPVPQMFLPTFRGGSAGNQGERARVDSEAFRVGDLPSGAIPEPLTAVMAPGVTSQGEEAPELFVDWPSAIQGTAIIPAPEAYTSVRVSLRGQKLARIRVGGSEGAVTSGAGGGVYVVCRVPEDAPRRFVSARWETLSRPSSGSAEDFAEAIKGGAKAAPKGPVTLTVTDAWFDMRECKARVVRRTSVEVKPLAGGLLFGYREPCAKCAAGSETELMTLLGPMPQSIVANGVGGEATTVLGGMTRVVLPVRKGGGGSMLVRYSPGIVSDWMRSLGAPIEAPSSDVVAGVDVTQGVEDAEPVAVAYSSVAEGQLAAQAAIELEDFEVPTPNGPHPMRPTIRQPRNGDIIDPFGTRSRSSGAPAKRVKPIERLGF